MRPVSAVIRTWNSERTLERTLASLQQQEPAIDEYIVVDSGSTDGTLEIARKFHARILMYPQGEEFNYSRALNIGIAEAGNEHILIISSHVVLLYPDVVRLMSDYLDEFDAVGAYCKFRKDDADSMALAEQCRGMLVTLIYSDNFDGHNGLWNPCALIRKAAWMDHPFSEDMPRAEDQEWAWWHYRHTRRPTVQIRNAGALYLNPYRSRRKEALDYAVIAHRLMPANASWRAIMRLCLNAITAGLRGRTDEAYYCLLCAWETGRAHFGTEHWHGRAHLKKHIGHQADSKQA